MTANDPESSFNPKHRIVGAVILISLAVIFLPMIFREKPPAPSATGLITGIPTAATRIVVTPVPPPALKSETTAEKAMDATPNVSAPVADAKAPVAKAPAPFAKVADTPPLRPKDKTVPVSPGSGQPPKQGWMVQVGTFSNASNATRIGEKLRKQGYAVQQENVALSRGAAVRVRVGPYQNRQQADAALARIRKETGIKGLVLAAK